MRGNVVCETSCSDKSISVPPGRRVLCCISQAGVHVGVVRLPLLPAVARVWAGRDAWRDALFSKGESWYNVVCLRQEALTWEVSERRVGGVAAVVGSCTGELCLPFEACALGVYVPESRGCDCAAKVCGIAAVSGPCFSH